MPTLDDQTLSETQRLVCMMAATMQAGDLAALPNDQRNDGQTLDMLRENVAGALIIVDEVTRWK